MSRQIEEIKVLALALRKKLGFENTEYLNMRAVLTETKRLFPGFDYQQVRDHELVDAEGMYDPDARVLKIPDRVFKALDRGVPRARFSIAHELAHSVLGHREIRFRNMQRKAYERTKPNIAREEREAEELAAFFLAPDHLCQGCMTVEDFIERFGLSRRAAEIRKQDYDRHLRRKSGEERPLTSQTIDLLQHLRSKGHKVTSLKDPPPQSIQPKNPANEQVGPPHCIRYMTDICPVCRNPTVLPVGHTFMCATCHAVFDRLQDGDPADA